jgi:hypothetical protein
VGRPALSGGRRAPSIALGAAWRHPRQHLPPAAPVGTEPRPLSSAGLEISRPTFPSVPELPTRQTLLPPPPVSPLPPLRGAHSPRVGGGRMAGQNQPGGGLGGQGGGGLGGRRCWRRNGVGRGQ